MKKNLLLAVLSLFTFASLKAQLTVSVSNIVGPTCNNGCNGSATVTATGGVAPYTYYWISNEQTASATALCGGFSRYVIVTDDMGEQVVTYFDVTNPPATMTVSITASETDSVCPGTPITFTAHGADTYEWYYGYSTANPLVYAPPSPTSIFVTGTNTATGCTAMATLAIPVKPRPTIALTQGPSYTCEGSPSYISVSGSSDYYTWSDGITRPDSFSVTQSFYGVVTGHSSTTGCTSHQLNPIITVFPAPDITIHSYPACRGSMNYVTAQGGNSYVWNTGSTNMQIGFLATNDTSFYVVGTGWAGCTDTAYITVHVNELPVVTATASDYSVCGNTTVNLYASGADQYSWSNGSQGDTLSHSVSYTEDLTVTGINTATGCQNTSSIHIEHTYMPDLYLYGATTYCSGDSLNMGAMNYDNYVWNPGAATGAYPHLYTPVSVTYTVTASLGASGCVATDSISVNILPLPIITAIADMDSVCPGTTVNLSATGGDYFSWSSSTQPQIDQTESFVVTGYSYSNSCINTDTITIVARELPVIVATASDSTICTGSATTLSVSGAATYQWLGPVNSSDATLSFTPSYSQQYTVEGTDVHGCVGTGAVTVNTIDIPNVTAYTDMNSFCAGGSATFHANGADTYVWNTGSTDQDYTLQVDSSFTYSVIGSSAGICFDTAYIVMNIYPLPVITVTPNNDTICEYSMLTLTGSGADYYEWQGLSNGFYSQGQWDYQITGNQTFTLRGQLNGCNSLPVTVSVVMDSSAITMQLPVETLCENATPVTLTNGGLPSNGWYSGNGVNGTIFDPLSAGVGTHAVHYYFTNVRGCSVTANDTITVDACAVGIAEANSFSGWNLFPNPTNGLLTLTAPQHQGAVTIEVYTATGQLVLSEKRGNFETSSIDLSALDNGAYFVRISNGVSGSNYHVVKTN